MSAVRRIRALKLVKGQLVSSSYWQGDPDEETRQQYANYRIAEMQRSFPDRTFAQLLGGFRKYGELYDHGSRLRDRERAA